MSTFYCQKIIDEPVEYEVHNYKKTNVKYVRVRFLKVGQPVGTMSLKIYKEESGPSWVLKATSNNINCDYQTDSNYSTTAGGTNIHDISNIRFDFNYEQILTGDHKFVLTCDATYYAGIDSDNYLCTVIDFPSETNRCWHNGLTITSYPSEYSGYAGDGFSIYPQLTIQMFGYDRGTEVNRLRYNGL